MKDPFDNVVELPKKSVEKKEVVNQNAERLRRLARNAQIWKPKVMSKELYRAADEIEKREKQIADLSDQTRLALAYTDLLNAMEHQEGIIRRLEADLEHVMALLDEEREKSMGIIH